jgi:NADH-quinone oxidoreductase subunit C
MQAGSAMNEGSDLLLRQLGAQFPRLSTSTFRAQTRLVVPRDELLELLRLLKERFGFDMLVDLTCVDYLHHRDATDRFGLVYLLVQTESGRRLTVRVYVNEPDLSVPSVVSLWEGANWLEREVWDMFGIRFQGHPDLRRILLPEQFAAHPLRKDYPLQGRGERHNFPVLTRSQA